MNIERVSLQVQIDGQAYYVVLPHERMVLLLKLAEGLSDSGQLPVKKAAPGFEFRAVEFA